MLSRPPAKRARTNNACTLRQRSNTPVSRNSDNKMLILLIRLRTETASEHTLSCTPGQAGRTLNLFKLRGCQVGEETQTPTPRDGHDDDDEARAAEPVSAVCQSATTRFQSRSGHGLGNPPSTRRITESPREMPGGFSGLASLRDGGPGSKQTLSKIRHRLTHAPLKTSLDFSQGRPPDAWLAAHAARSSNPAQPPAQRPENEERPRQDRPRLYNVWPTRSGLSVNGISRRGGRRSETCAGPRNGGLAPAHALQYMHYTASQHVYSMYTHATPDPTYGLEGYMASWLALRPSGAQPQARPSPGCRT